MVLVVGYLSIDTIETSSGSVQDVAGGAALYAALGARLAGAEVAIAACAGEDYPADWLRRLDALGIDTAGIERRSGPTRRARLSYEGADTRRSRHDQPWWDRTRALAPPGPDRLEPAAMVVAGPMPVEALGAWLAQARAAEVPVVADTSAPFVRLSRDSILAALPWLAAFAPSREETRLLLPGVGDDEAALALARAGPDLLQKRGPEGALAVAAGGGESVAIPAPPARAVDPTGAGDAAVGALAAALADGRPFPEAARRGLEAGAVAVAGIGPAALGFGESADHPTGTGRRA